MNIGGDKIRLRALEPADAELLYRWENDTELWGVSGTTEPFSHEQMERFIEAQRRGDDLVRSGQLRLIIERAEDGAAVGMVDMFEYDPLNNRAGVGIMTGAPYRRRGYGAAALAALCGYARRHLHMRQLWASVAEENTASLRLFTAAGFTQTGTQRDWVRTGGGYADALFFQIIFEEN